MGNWGKTHLGELENPVVDTDGNIGLKLWETEEFSLDNTKYKFIIACETLGSLPIAISHSSHVTIC